jgi:hypothetical protein
MFKWSVSITTNQNLDVAWIKGSYNNYPSIKYLFRIIQESKGKEKH